VASQSLLLKLDGNTYVLAIGEWDSSPYSSSLIIQPKKAQAGQLRRLGLLKEAWSVDVDLSMRKQGRLDRSLYIEANGDPVDSYAIELV
jgi:hypothetical protein